MVARQVFGLTAVSRSRGHSLGTVRVEAGSIAEHRAGDVEQAVGHRTQGTGVSVAAGAQSAVLAVAHQITLGSNPSPVEGSLTQPVMGACRSLYWRSSAQTPHGASIAGAPSRHKSPPGDRITEGGWSLPTACPTPRFQPAKSLRRVQGATGIEIGFLSIGAMKASVELDGSPEPGLGRPETD